MQTQTVHLDRLGMALAAVEWTSHIVRTPGRETHLRVANPDVPEVTERVVCRPAPDGSPCYWWAWGLPIGAVDDVETAVRRIRHALRAVEDHR